MSEEQKIEPVEGEPQQHEAIHASDEAVEREMRRHSRRSFLWAAAATAAGLSGWRWLVTRREDDGLPWPLRRALEINEQLARDYYRGSRLAPTFPRERAREPRENGDIGLDAAVDLNEWRLKVTGLSPATLAEHRQPDSDQKNVEKKSGDDQSADDQAKESSDGQAALMKLTLAQIRALPRVEMVTELKCIEGWSEVVHWTGARFADFINVYRPATLSGNLSDPPQRPEDLVRYVSLATEDGGYYVGLEMESAMHPQTLLCYEMNGLPLTPEHGAPLRLVIPVKYGIKNIKSIGTIRFTNQRPADYWAERGYDWYAGH